MKLLIVLITYNRLDYTKRTLKSLLSTIDVPYYLVAVDNKSSDGTRKWLHRKLIDVVENPVNYYPGKACNIGWEFGIELYPEATHLMRCDNDMEFTKGWASKAEQYFEEIPELGQLGLDNTALDSYNGNPAYLSPRNATIQVNAWPGNVGGPCIVRRRVYDMGARYDEVPWQDLEMNKATPQEDVKFSLSMHKLGYIYGHPTKRLGWTFATPDTWKKYPKYYKKTMSERGYKYEDYLPR